MPELLSCISAAIILFLIWAIVWEEMKRGPRWDKESKTGKGTFDEKKKDDTEQHGN